MRDALRPTTGWSGLILLTTMLLVVAWSVEAASWAEGLGVLSAAVLAAVATSLILAKLPWMPGTLAHAWAVVLGFLWTLLLGTRVMPSYFPDVALDGMPLATQMSAVRDALGGWLGGLRSGVAAEGSAFVFVMATAFLVWLLAYVSVRFLVRYASFWGAVLPAGVALVANLYYAKTAPSAHLAVFLLCSLLLAALTSVAVNEDYWRQARIPYSPDISLDFLKDGAVIAVAVLLLGWLAPAEVKSAPLSAMAATVSGASGGLQSQFNRMFPDIRYATRGAGGAYGEAMPLGGSISLGTTPIFDVRLDGDLVPRYWRMAVFDTYDGSGWRRGPSTTVGVPGELTVPRAPYSVPVTQTVETLQPFTGQLVAAPQPGTFSVPVRAQVAEGAPAADVLAVQPVDPLGVGASYRAVSSLVTVDQATLRAAGEADPEWVRQRYLSLPASAELEAVARTAAGAVGTATNRYDAADGIENWLRRIPYSEEVSSPPEAGDRVAWFLYQERRGYCDYFSSAFVVMARAVGIPARVAAGYSLGEPLQGKYRQRAYDAHSWPEVYFPGVGWVEFEPTPADPEITRPAGPAEAADGESTPGPDRQQDDMLPDEDRLPPRPDLPDTEAADGALATRLPWAWLVAAVLGTLGAAVAIRAAWERPLAGLDPATAMYARVVRAATWLRRGPRRADTPFEFAERFGAAVPGTAAPVGEITGAYVRARFGRGPAATSSAALSQAWLAVRRASVGFAARSVGHRLLPAVRRGRDLAAAGRRKA